MDALEKDYLSCYPDDQPITEGGFEDTLNRIFTQDH